MAIPYSSPQSYFVAFRSVQLLCLGFAWTEDSSCGLLYTQDPPQDTALTSKPAGAVEAALPVPRHARVAPATCPHQTRSRVPAGAVTAAGTGACSGAPSASGMLRGEAFHLVSLAKHLMNMHTDSSLH